MFDTINLMQAFARSAGNQVTIANMQDAPFNRWAFRNMPTGNVWSGDGEKGLST